ncbi:MAG: single-stranded-DNA-specific exonuclease RecJ [Anaerolineales bacterium]|nr:single-stranded-DNA-specific exonuclease RecJ [Anaerolineales bacterium]
MDLPRLNWFLPGSIPDDIDTELSSYSPAFRSVLYQRNLCTEDEVLNFLLPKEPPWFSSQLPLNSDKACKIIQSAIENDEVIAVYGDYDADGITSTAMLTLALSKVSDKVISYIPNRFTEGYGLNREALSSLSDEGVSLVITVDNGIRSFDEVKYANSLGLKVIISDHHTPETTLPPAIAIINPKLPNDSYPDENLSGAGVTFKLITALSKIYSSLNPSDYLDLVAIGSVADVVPLVGENRYLVRKGLSSLNQIQRQGVLSLLGASSLVPGKIRSSDISFQIGPRLNSSGRLGSADIPLKLLLSQDAQICGDLAQIIDNHNFQRKKISQELLGKAELQLKKEEPLPFIFFALDHDFHLGVAGIAAGVLARKYHVPVIVGTIGPEYTTASCRSIPEFNLISALDYCEDLFVRYGGHSQAAGFTIANENVSELRNRLAVLAEKELSNLDLRPSIFVDAITSLDQLNASLYSELDKLEPTGCQNPEPIFLTTNLSATQVKVIGQDGDHLKMKVSDGILTLDAIGFGLGFISDNIPSKFDAVYTFKLNEYRGKKSFQLQISDLKPANN